MTRLHTRSQEHLTRARTRSLLLGSVFVAAVLNGMLAWGIDRTLIDMPAWQHVGAPAWAAYSQWADLGTFGMILYPLEGIGGAVFSLIAAILCLSAGQRILRGAVLPIYAAALLALGGLLATTQAAPAISSTAQHLGDPASLQQALNAFWLWGGVRAGFQFLAFCANLWSLIAVSRDASSDRTLPTGEQAGD